MAVAAVHYLKEVVDVLREYEETEQSLNSTLLQVGVTAVGAFIGAFFGGRSGVALGAGAAGAASCLLVEDYKPLYQCIDDMPDYKKREVAGKIQRRVGNPGKEALLEFVRQLPQNAKWIREQIQGAN